MRKDYPVHPSLSGMVDAIRAKISRVALHLRFTAQASKFLQACLEMVLKQCVCTDRITPSALDAFRRVLIFDSSSWDVNPGLKHVLPGFGGGASDANGKLQAGYEYTSGSLGFFEVTEGIKPDQAYSKSLVDFVEKNDLMLTDRGYFKLSVFQNLIEKEAYFLSKILYVAHKKKGGQFRQTLQMHPRTRLPPYTELTHYRIHRGKTVPSGN